MSDKFRAIILGTLGLVSICASIEISTTASANMPLYISARNNLPQEPKEQAAGRSSSNRPNCGQRPEQRRLRNGCQAMGKTSERVPGFQLGW